MDYFQVLALILKFELVRISIKITYNIISIKLVLFPDYFFFFFIKKDNNEHLKVLTLFRVKIGLQCVFEKTLSCKSILLVVASMKKSNSITCFRLCRK